MATAFTGGFRVAQTKLAISKLLPESTATSALESAQVVALAILVREQMSQGEFAGHYRPFATILPGPGYEPPPAIDRQIALFMEFLPSLDGDAKLEVMAVAKALSDSPKPLTPASPTAAVPSHTHRGGRSRSARRRTSPSRRRRTTGPGSSARPA